MEKSITKIVLVNFLVFVVIIAIIEIFFGHWFAEHSFGPYMREHRLKKNHAVLTYNDIQYDYYYKRNYHGFRGEEIDPAQIEAVMIGGSTTDERYKPIEFSIAENLNLLLKKNGYNFKIINAGIEGQSTYGHIHNFKNWFPKLKNFSPKLYIFYIGLNDYSFEPDQDEYSNYNYVADGNVMNAEAVEVFFDTIKSNSFFYDKLRILKQKYYSTAKTVKYFHDSEKLKDLKYVNYKQALELHDVEKLKIKHQIVISKYLNRIKILNSFVSKKNSTAVFINQVLATGNENEKLFILNYSLIEYCKNTNIYCIDLAAQLNGKINYWWDKHHTTGLGSKAVAKTVINDLIKVIKRENLF